MLGTFQGDLVVDMFDDSEIANSGLLIDIIFRGDGLLEFTFEPSRDGEWVIETTPINSQDYNTEVNK